MFVTESGIVTSVRFMHNLKAAFSMFVTESGRVTLVRFLQP